jgi:hypothetical protein
MGSGTVILVVVVIATKFWEIGVEVSIAPFDDGSPLTKVWLAASCCNITKTLLSFYATFVVENLDILSSGPIMNRMCNTYIDKIFNES